MSSLNFLLFLFPLTPSLLQCQEWRCRRCPGTGLSANVPGPRARRRGLHHGRQGRHPGWPTEADDPARGHADPADSDKVVIVGGGSGAVGAVEALREKGFPGSITVVSAEGYLPIDRPKLSKALLPDAAKLQLRDQAWYDAGSIAVTFAEVTAVDFANKTVTTDSGAAIPYTQLILATGGTPRRLPLDGFATLGRIFTLRSVHDVQAIVAALGTSQKKVVVIGSSFIGLEVANALVKDHAVTVVGPAQVPLENVLGAQVGRAIQRGLEKAGVVFRLSSAIAKAEPAADDASRVGAVLLQDGTRLAADLVVQGVGMKPATDFLRDNSAFSLQQDGSLLTDESFAVAGLSDVYAVGDIATFPFHGPAASGRLVRIEHWNVAQKAGRIVGESIARPAVRRSKNARGTSDFFFTPVFWSALSAQLRYCGNTAASGWDDVVVQGSLDEGSWAAFYTKDETVVAVATMGKDPVMVQSAELINTGKMPSKTLLAAGLDVLSLGPP